VLTIEAPKPAPAAVIGYDPSAVETIERLLVEAGTAVDAGDPDAAGAALERAKRLVIDRPELPQAAWLMAEIWHVEAESLEARAPDVAATLRTKAGALAGPRARPYSPEPAQPSPAGVPGRDSVTVPLEGPRPSDAVYVDGTRLTGPRQVEPGTHHVRVLRDSQPVYARWVEARVEAGALELVVARPPPCSAEDLGAPAIIGSRLRVAPDVACPRWAVARAVPRGIEVALCFASSCGSFLEWRRDWGAVLRSPPQPGPEPAAIPAWLGWTLAGAAAIAGGSIIAWRAGAFDSPDRGPPRPVLNGPDAE
jgi:hypothetical protein